MEQTKPKLVFFAHERNEARIRKRIGKFNELSNLSVFSFHRERKGVENVPIFYQNIHLGETIDNAYHKRILKLLFAIPTVLKHRKLLKEADIIYAVNLDMIGLAIVCRWLCRSKANIGYECADIMEVLIKKGLIPDIFRILESIVVTKVHYIITTSNAFIQNHFSNHYHYKGNTFLLENKTLAPQQKQKWEINQVWRIGYFGAIRCKNSWEILKNLAQTLDNKIYIEIRGFISNHFFEEKVFLDELQLHKNITFLGSYTAPQDLAKMYSEIDFCWTFDFYSKQSEWLLPNRIYESGAYGVPALGDAMTETGKWIEEKGSGWTFKPDYTQNLIQFFQELTPEAYTEMRNNVANLPQSYFVDIDDHQRLIKELLS